MRGTPLNPKMGVYIQNGSDTMIPPRSIVIATNIATDPRSRTTEETTVTTVEMYTGQIGNVLITGSAGIMPGQFGRAFYEPFVFASIDTDVDPPKFGEQWGPVPGKWFMSRGGMGFFCHGFDSVNAPPGRAMFQRKEGYYFGKLTSDLAPGKYATPTNATFDVWHPDPTIGGPGQPLVKATPTALLGQVAYNYSASQFGTTDYDCIVQMLPQGLVFVAVGCATS